MALLGTLASACSSAGSTERPEAPRDLLIRAKEFSYSAPDTVAAGIVSVRLVNEGSEMHHVQLVRIGEGHTFEELRASAAAGNPFPLWVTPVGGPNEASLGTDVRVALDLPAGQYAMLCLIPSFRDRTPHFAKGILRPLVVIPSGTARGPEPVTDGRIVLADYSFTTSPAIRAGRHTLRVENAAGQPHEVLIARLDPGKTVDDLLDWVGRLDSPPPGKTNGGTTVIAPGGVNWMTASFAPGEYVMICFARDVADGRSHLAHGMVRQFKVN
jgi:hypothetical protein